jgi:two-component system, NtrC family, response regulator GlrR
MAKSRHSEQTIDLLIVHLGTGSVEAVKLAALLKNTEGISVCVASVDDAAPRLNTPSVVVLVAMDHLRPADESVFRDLKHRFQVAVLAAGVRSDLDSIIRWMESGATDYFTAPWNLANILPRIKRAARVVDSATAARSQPDSESALEQMVGQSHAFRAVVDRIPAASSCDASVLIQGETGTGKELFARAVHYLGRRSGKAFVPLNCAAIPADLVENELFGHAAGAYTGAGSRQPGLIEEAEGGSLFLDEADSLPLPAQAKLLRFLQSKEYRPLGVTRTQMANVRVIAATNTDVSSAVKSGKLRQDLFYRLNVIPLLVPALRERLDDVPLLAYHFMKRFSREYGRTVVSVSDAAVERLMTYNWPGNVRELENVIARAVAFAVSPVLGTNDLQLPETEPPEVRTSLRAAKVQFERAYIEQKLRHHSGNVSRAARDAGKNRRSFWELIRKHRIEVEQFRLPAT